MPAIVLIYTTIAVFAYWNMWSKGAGSHATGAGGDISQSVWFLAWPAYALVHGLNPLLSSFANYPYGINMLANTSTVALGVLFTPVTLVAGPVVTYNLAMTAAMASSGVAAFLLARRFTPWVPAAFAAGLLYGFSPYMAAEGIGHVMTTFVPLPPLILLLVHDVVVRQPSRPILRGSLLGALVVVQFFVSIEVLVDLLVLVAVALAIAAISHRREVATRLRYAGIAFGCAALVCAVLLAYPIWVFFAGPAHVNGALHYDNPIYSADLLGPIVPDTLQRIAPASLLSTSSKFAGNISENGSYLGVPLILVVLAGVIWLRRVAFVRLAGVMCGVAFVLSLGPRLRVANHVTSIPLPDALLGRLPFLSNGIPVRLSLFVVLFAAIVLAGVLEHVHDRTRRRGAKRTGPVLVGLLAVAVFVPLAPAWPYSAASTPTPPFFAGPAVDSIPAGDVVVVYPFPDLEYSEPEQWQASAFMRFRLVGGRFKVALPRTGTATGAEPSETDHVLSALAAGDPPPRSPQLRREVVSELEQWQVHDIVAVPPTSNEGTAIPYLTWLLGRAPVTRAGAWVWYGWRG